MKRIATLLALTALVLLFAWASDNHSAKPLRPCKPEPCASSGDAADKVLSGRIPQEEPAKSKPKRYALEWLFQPQPEDPQQGSSNEKSPSGEQGGEPQARTEETTESGEHFVDDANDANEASSPKKALTEEEIIKLERQPRGPDGTVERVQPNLAWLADHQHADGYWSAQYFGECSKRANAARRGNCEFVAPNNPYGDCGISNNGLAVTALSLLTFAGAGHDHRMGRYKECCRKALGYLRKIQDNSGRFIGGEDGFLPAHALCTQAVAECYSISGDPMLKTTAEKAVETLVRDRDQSGGWARRRGGYGSDGEADVATTAWSVLALKSAKMADIEFEHEPIFKGVVAFLDSVTVKAGEGFTTRLRPSGGNAPDCRAAGFNHLPTLDAMNALCRLVCGAEDPKAASLAHNCIAHLPTWQGATIDFTYWFFATHVLYTLGGKDYKLWEPALCSALNDNQRGFKKGEERMTPVRNDEFGSWDAVDAYSWQGGRVYSTAMASLSMEVLSRYLRSAYKG